MNSPGSVTFLNHSSICVSSETTSILCDPWFTGSAFDDGWRLLVEDSHNLRDLPHDYIWVSHEHPDHFSIPTLRQIQRPTRFIYQKAADGKVKAYLSKQHEVFEIGDLEQQTFGDIACTLYGSDGYDSAMLFRLPGGQAVLNLNDCRAELGAMADHLSELSGQVDLLAMQFSYANWAGNPGDEIIPEFMHQQVLDRMEQVIGAIRPKAVLLFASYVYFSHEENFFWNSRFWLDAVRRRLEPRAKVIIPRPNDVISLDELATTDFTARNDEAARYWTDRHATRIVVDRAKRSLSVEELAEAFQAFQATLWTDNDLPHARATCCGELELSVRLTDLNRTLKLELFGGAMREAADGGPFDVEISSETLSMLFKSRFGRGTVTINGRVKLNYMSAFRFFAFFFPFYANNIGKYLRPGGGLAWADLRSVARTAVLEAIFHARPSAVGEFDRFLQRFLTPQPASAN